ncbi:MAG: SPOR domain-containing protein [Acidiferrobacterales bacterium]
MPNWAFVAIGLAIGITLTTLVQVFIERGTSPDSGLNTLIRRATKAGAPEREPASAPTTKTAKPKFDFYTILPEIETVMPESEPARATRPAKVTSQKKNVSYVLQAGSFAKFEDADRLKARLALNGLVASIQRVTIQGKGEYHRVRLGPYDNLKELDVTNRRLNELGIRALRLKVSRGR